MPEQNASSTVASRTVVHVIAPAAFGGIESVVLHLTRTLRHSSSCVVVAALGGVSAEHPWVRLIMEQGTPVLFGPPGLYGKWTEHRWLRNILLHHDTTVVHSHGYRADIAAMRARVPGCRWVSTVHGFTGANWRVRAFERIDRHVLRRADRVICVSTRLSEELAAWGVPADKLRVIRNAPRPTQLLPREAARHALGLRRHGIIVGWVGRFSAEKGPDRLASVLPTEDASPLIALVGDGPLRESTMRSLAHHPWGAHWFAPRSDVAKLLPAFDILLLTSRSEGMPMIVLEAMAAGVPVVAFDVGDVRYAVNDETGWLVPADDEPAFAMALSAALNSPTTRGERGLAAARLIASQFSSDEWVQQHLNCYHAA